jgi:hypothetical protein
VTCVRWNFVRVTTCEFVSKGSPRVGVAHKTNLCLRILFLRIKQGNHTRKLFSLLFSLSLVKHRVTNDLGIRKDAIIELVEILERCPWSVWDPFDELGVAVYGFKQ